jgi:hypothetical protein
MAKTNNQFGGEILHANATRLRVTGSGNLYQILYSLDDISSEDLTDIAMASTTAIQPTQLANFTSQRIYLELGTLVINETFNISKITVFIKPLYSEYPR